MLAAARLDAAGEEGDMLGAAAVLDTMQRKQVEPNLIHFSSAVRVCRTADGLNYKVARYFLDKVLERRIAPDVVFFTSLMQTYSRADLEYCTSAYGRMVDLGISPDPFFARVYLSAVLRISPGKVLDLKNVRRDRLLACQQLRETWECSSILRYLNS